MYPGFLVPGVVTIPIGAFSSPAAMAARMRHRMRHPCRSDWRRLCVDGFRRRRSDREFDFADLVLTAYSHPPLAERTPMSPHVFSEQYNSVWFLRLSQNVLRTEKLCPFSATFFRCVPYGWHTWGRPSGKRRRPINAARR